jgi:hypothetical protein
MSLSFGKLTKHDNNIGSIVEKSFLATGKRKKDETALSSIGTKTINPLGCDFHVFAMARGLISYRIIYLSFQGSHKITFFLEPLS